MGSSSGARLILLGFGYSGSSVYYRSLALERGVVLRGGGGSSLSSSFSTVMISKRHFSFSSMYNRALRYYRLAESCVVSRFVGLN